MNLTQIIQTVGDEISAAIDSLSKRGITVASVDAEIVTLAVGMTGAAEFTQTVKINGLKNHTIICGALMQANSVLGRMACMTAYTIDFGKPSC